MSTAVAIVESRPSEAELLGAEITRMCSYIYAAEARLLDLIRLFDKRRHWQELGLSSCAHWLNFKCGVGMNAAREKVRVAHALADLPKIALAFGKGELSYSKVRALTRIADETNEDYLLMVAHHGTAHHVEKLVSKYRLAKRVQDAEVTNEQYNNRDLSHYYDHDGCLVIKARLPAEQGALIVKALEMAMEKDFNESDRADEVRDDVTAVTSERIAVRRADALADIAETYMNNSESSGSTADRYQVVVHVSADAVPSRQTPEIEDGPHVTAETSRRIACDCSMVGVTEDENGEPLSISRRSRSIPPAMRRALRMRDGGCRFPGCTNTRFVDGHHIKHWADGGETCLDNLVLLCRHHHRLVHEGGFGCERTADGEMLFRDPAAQSLEPWSGMTGISTDNDVHAWFDRDLNDVETDACAARWRAGEHIDWQVAVSALF